MNNSKTNSSNNKNAKKNNRWIILIVALLIIGAFLVYYMLTRNTTVSWAQLQIWMTDVSEGKGKFSRFVIDSKYHNITGIFVDANGTSHRFIVGLPPAADANYQSIITELNNLKIDFNYQAFSAPTFFHTFFVTWLPFILISGILFWLLTRMSSGGNKAFSLGKSQARLEKSNVKFSDVAGNEEAKQEVREIVDFLKHPAKYFSVGARIPKGVLLGGAPGTGKTLLAKAVAGEAGVPFFSMSGSEFDEIFVGVGMARVRSLFAQAKKNAPCIIFIDELDAAGRKRNSGQISVNEQTLNQLLTEMDGFTTSQGVVIIGATNRPDVLDPALMRPGRFDRLITIPLPDIKERKAILEVHARNKKFDESIDFANIAARTPGFSGAQLENVINEAAILTVRNNIPRINREEIDEAIDRVAFGPAKVSRIITPEEKRMIAFHEAGHAVVGLSLPDGNIVHKVTIIPRGQAGGYNLMMPRKEKYTKTKLELLSSVASFMGGRASEAIMYGDDQISTGAHNDIEQATNIARRMVTQYGMSNLGAVQYEREEGSMFLGKDQKIREYSGQIAFEIDKEVRSIIDEAYKKAKEIILKRKKLLHVIAEALIKQETLVKEEIEYIEKNGKLPPSSLANSMKKAKTAQKAKLEDAIKSVSSKAKVVNGETVSSDKKTTNETNWLSKEESAPAKKPAAVKPTPKSTTPKVKKDETKDKK